MCSDEFLFNRRVVGRRPNHCLALPTSNRGVGLVHAPPLSAGRVTTGRATGRQA